MWEFFWQDIFLLFISNISDVYFCQERVTERNSFAADANISSVFRPVLKN